MCQCLISFCYAACLTASLHRKARKEHHARHQRYRCDPRESPFRRAFCRRCSRPDRESPRRILQGDAGRADCTGSAAEPPAPQTASQPGMSQQAPVAAAAPCYQPQVPAMPAYAAPTPDAVAEKAQETVPQHPQAPTVKHPAPYEPPAYVPAASAPEPHPVYDQPSPAVNPYRQPAPDTTATLPAQDATASQPEPGACVPSGIAPSI